MHADSAEEFAGAVEDVPDGAVDEKGTLGGELFLGCHSCDGGELDGGGFTFKGEVAGDDEVLGAGRGVFDGFCAADFEDGFGVVLDVEEVVALEVGDESIVGVALEVVAPDVGHVDYEAAASEFAVFDFYFAGFDADATVVVIEKVASGPHEVALAEVELVGAFGNVGFGRGIAGAFGGEVGSGPGGVASFEQGEVGVAESLHFLDGHFGFFAFLVCAVDDVDGVFVRGGSFEAIGEGDFEHAVADGSGDVGMLVIVEQANIEIGGIAGLVCCGGSDGFHEDLGMGDYCNFLPLCPAFFRAPVCVLFSGMTLGSLEFIYIDILW